MRWVGRVACVEEKKNILGVKRKENTWKNKA
jgi:hypothetical protein